jgi:CDGSH iron-sulfur domain-containing protein 3
MFQKKPYIVELTEKPQFVCQCGQSSKYPLCDGSHKGYKDGKCGPLKVDLSSGNGKAKLYVCGCGYSGKVPGQPFCDGTHNKLDKSS